MTSVGGLNLVNIYFDLDYVENNDGNLDFTEDKGIIYISHCCPRCTCSEKSLWLTGLGIIYCKICGVYR